MRNEINKGTKARALSQAHYFFEKACKTIKETKHNKRQLAKPALSSELHASDIIESQGAFGLKSLVPWRRRTRHHHCPLVRELSVYQSGSGKETPPMVHELRNSLWCGPLVLHKSQAHCGNFFNSWPRLDADRVHFGDGFASECGVFNCISGFIEHAGCAKVRCVFENNFNSIENAKATNVVSPYYANITPIG